MTQQQPEYIITGDQIKKFRELMGMIPAYDQKQYERLVNQIRSRPHSDAVSAEQRIKDVIAELERRKSFATYVNIGEAIALLRGEIP